MDNQSELGGRMRLGSPTMADSKEAEIDLEGFDKVTDDGGVMKKILKEGDEAEYEDDDETPQEGAMVGVHYTGYLFEEGEWKEFETSREGHHFSFTVGDNSVLQGWDLVVRTMKANEECSIIVKPKYGYGKKDRKGIPGNSTLKFDIELLEFF